MLKARIREYGIDEVVRAIRNVSESTFLKGGSKSGWTITFDWFVKPNNFPKVLEGNYTDKTGPNVGEPGKNAKGRQPDSIDVLEEMLVNEKGGDDDGKQS
jgi:hypothetical protein